MMKGCTLACSIHILYAYLCSAFPSRPAFRNRQAKSPPIISSLRLAGSEDRVETHKHSSKWIPQAVVTSIVSLALITPLPSYSAVSASSFNNEYADPLHPFCNRKIQVSRDGKTFHYSGTSVGPKDEQVLRGCSTEEIKLYVLRKGEFDGVITDKGSRISAGDGIHEGVWEPKNTANTRLGYEDVDGIRWNDGNKWIVKSQSFVKKTEDGNTVVKKPTSVVIGEFIFLAYIGFSMLAGVYGVINRIRQQ